MNGNTIILHPQTKLKYCCVHELRAACDLIQNLTVSVCGFVIVFLLLLFSELKNLQVHGSNDGKVT